MTVVPMIDTDQDGLSDQEEATGHDNILAVAAPAGLSNPFAFDSDGDGMSDGNEALAGTTATDAGSVFKAAAIHLTSNGWLEIVWPAIPGRFYLFEYNPGLASTNWKQLAAINALSPTLRISDTNMPAESFRMYRLGVGY